MKIFHFTKISSTNDIARSLIENESELIITADEQTAGRGRQKRTWMGDFQKNLYLTYSVNHLKVETFQDMISFLAASSVFTLLCFRHFAPNNTFKIKYPNDIYCLYDNNYKKIAGILTEHIYIGSSPKYSIIGIGANINQELFLNELANKATSLNKIGVNVSVKEFGIKLSSYFATMYNLDEKKIINQWKEEVNIAGKECLLISSNKKLLVREHLDDGRLLLVDGTEELIIDDGESIVYEL